MSNFLIDEDTDLLAAEFVLGTLDSQERASAQSLLRADHGFIAMVRIWERRFGELHLMVEPVEPDAEIFQRIRAKITEIAPSEPAPVEVRPAAEGKPPAVPAPPIPATPSVDGKPPAVAMPAPEGKPPIPSMPSIEGKLPAAATPTPEAKPPAVAMPAPEGKPPIPSMPSIEGKLPAAATLTPEGKPPAVAMT